MTKCDSVYGFGLYLVLPFVDIQMSGGDDVDHSRVFLCMVMYGSASNSVYTLC